MMKRTMGLSLLVVMLSTTEGGAREQDKKADEVAQGFSKIAATGPGVHAIKKDTKGRIVSCVIVGSARISTVLGKANGLETARTQARLACGGEFRKWIKEKVTVCEKLESETIVLLEGAEEANKDIVKETGKSVEKTTKRYETVAEGLVRGLQVLHFEVDGENKTYTLVMGWHADTAEGTKKIDRDMQDSPKPGGEKDKGGKGDPAPKGADKTIENKKVTSPDARSFLPDR
jgi:hypothetical protein